MIWQRFFESVDAAPDRTAVVWRGSAITASALAGMAESLAADIPIGTPVDDRPGRVLVRQADPLAILLCVLAAWRAGKTPVLLREGAVDTKVAEMESILRPARAYTEPLAIERLRAAERPRPALEPIDPRAEALAINTSGSTGAPKLVMLPARSVALNADTIAARLGFVPDDRILVNTPLTYMYGLMGGTVSGLLAGATVHLVDPRTPWPVVQGQLRREGIGVVQGPPSSLSLFDAFWNGKPFPGVRLVTAGGEPVREQLAARLAAAFPDADRRIVYGMTEAGPRIADDDLAAGRFFGGVVGVPYGHLRVRIDPVESPGLPPGAGRLALAGPSMFLGYLQPDGSYGGIDADGFFRSPDLVSMDAEGRLRIHGRVDRLFKTGGRLVNPAEIEAVIAGDPRVRAVICRAEPHRLLGFTVVADVVVDPGFTDAATVLRRRCEASLDSHAIPAKIRPVDRLVLAESGKASLGNVPRAADTDRSENRMT